MTLIQKLKTKAKNIGLAATVAAVSWSSGCTSLKPYFQKIHGKVGITKVSEYNTRPGFVPSGAATQGLAAISVGDTSFYAWGNRDDNDGLTEVDVGVSQKIPITKDISLRAGIEHQRDPRGEYANLIVAGANANLPGGFNIDLEAAHLIGERSKEEATILNAKVSRRTNLFKYKGWQFSLSPYIQTTRLKGLGKNNGISRIMPGISAGAEKGGWSIKAFINQQLGNFEVDGIGNGIYTGIGIGKKF